MQALLFLSCVPTNGLLENINPLSANPTKWPNTLKQFVGKIADELFECAWPLY